MSDRPARQLPETLMFKNRKTYKFVMFSGFFVCLIAFVLSYDTLFNLSARPIDDRPTSAPVDSGLVIIDDPSQPLGEPIISQDPAYISPGFTEPEFEILVNGEVCPDTGFMASPGDKVEYTVRFTPSEWFKNKTAHIYIGIPDDMTLTGVSCPDDGSPMVSRFEAVVYYKELVPGKVYETVISGVYAEQLKTGDALVLYAEVSCDAIERANSSAKTVFK